MTWSSFILGWIACAVFMAAWEIGTQLIERFRIQRRLEQIAAELRAECDSHLCPWPQNFEAPTRIGGQAGRGNVVRLHRQVSSRLLSGGSEVSR